jgi:hypothetical protein
MFRPRRNPLDALPNAFPSELVEEAILRVVAAGYPEAVVRRVAREQNAMRYATLALASARAERAAEAPAAPDPTLYRYGLRFRPPGIGAVPPGYLRVDPSDPVYPDDTRFGVLVYNKPLSDEDVRRYQLYRFLPAGEVERQVYEKMMRAVSGEDLGEMAARFAEDPADTARLLRVYAPDAYFSDKPWDQIGRAVVDLVVDRFGKAVPEVPAVEVRDYYMPSLNKQDALVDYVDPTRNPRWDRVRGHVEGALDLTPAQWDSFARALMTDRAEIKGKGGNDTTTPGPWPEGGIWDWPEAARKRWKDGSYHLLTAVRAPNRPTFYVDPQGYSYARYVLFDASEPAEEVRRRFLDVLRPAPAPAPAPKGVDLGPVMDVLLASGEVGEGSQRYADDVERDLVSLGVPDWQAADLAAIAEALWDELYNDPALIEDKLRQELSIRFSEPLPPRRYTDETPARTPAPVARPAPAPAPAPALPVAGRAVDGQRVVEDQIVPMLRKLARTLTPEARVLEVDRYSPSTGAMVLVFTLAEPPASSYSRTVPLMVEVQFIQAKPGIYAGISLDVKIPPKPARLSTGQVLTGGVRDRIWFEAFALSPRPESDEIEDKLRQVFAKIREGWPEALRRVEEIDAIEREQDAARPPEAPPAPVARPAPARTPAPAPAPATSTPALDAGTVAAFRDAMQAVLRRME